MKTKVWFIIAVVSVVGCAGCAQHYQVTLGNGATITARSRPKLDAATGTYRFKDAQNKPVALPKISVREIERL